MLIEMGLSYSWPAVPWFAYWASCEPSAVRLNLRVCQHVSPTKPCLVFDRVA